MARCDTDRSATYVSDERRALLAALGYNFDSPDADRRLVVNRPSRRSLLSLAEQHARVGLPNPRETTLDFSSHDGYAFFGLEGTGDIPVQPIWPSFRSDTTRAMSSSDPAPAVCTFDLTTCFGDAFLSPASDSVISVSETLARVAYKYPQCGDCLITLLVGKSGAAGLEAFLPADVDKEADEGRWDAELEASVQAVGLEETSWQAIDFSRGLEGTTGPSLRAKVRLSCPWAWRSSRRMLTSRDDSAPPSSTATATRSVPRPPRSRPFVAAATRSLPSSAGSTQRSSRSTTT